MARIKCRRVYCMNEKKGKKGQIEAKKGCTKELNSCAVEIFNYLEGKRQFLEDAGKLGANLDGKERRRLYGAGVKNFGFIEMAYEIARDNPEFMPPHFDVGSLREGLQVFKNIRQLVLELEQYLQSASTVMLLESDLHYRNALRVYGSLKDQTRNRIDGAEPLFRALQPFFHRKKRQTGKPTVKEAIRDAKKLARGKAEGEIVIINESPHVTG